MPCKDPQKAKECKRQWYLKNKEKLKQQRKQNIVKYKQYQKQWYDKNKEKQLEKNKEYQQEYQKQSQHTEKEKKRCRIKNWKKQGIIFHDYNLLYDIYLQTTHCDECKCLLNQCGKSRKCCDHDHSITDDNNVRNILCHSCNRKRN